MTQMNTDDGGIQRVSDPGKVHRTVSDIFTLNSFIHLCPSESSVVSLIVQLKVV